MKTQQGEAQLANNDPARACRSWCRSATRRSNWSSGYYCTRSASSGECTVGKNESLAIKPSTPSVDFYSALHSNGLAVPNLYPRKLRPVVETTRNSYYRSVSNPWKSEFTCARASIGSSHYFCVQRRSERFVYVPPNCQRLQRASALWHPAEAAGQS